MKIRKPYSGGATGDRPSHERYERQERPGRHSLVARHKYLKLTSVHSENPYPRGKPHDNISPPTGLVSSVTTMVCWRPSSKQILFDLIHILPFSAFCDPGGGGRKSIAPSKFGVCALQKCGARRSFDGGLGLTFAPRVILGREGSDISK